MKKGLILIAAAAAGSLAFAAQARPVDLLAYWSFNDLPGGGAAATFPISADEGSGTLTTNFAEGTTFSFTGTTVNAVDGYPAGADLALRNGDDGINNGRWILFEISTAGYQDLELSLATRRTSTGFTSGTVAWSTDGNTFTDHSSYHPGDTTYSLREIDLSDIAAINDLATVYIRILFDGGSDTASTGNVRIDNVQFNATAIPAPGALALLGIAGLIGTRRRR